MIAKPPALPCKKDALVDKGAEAPKSYFSGEDMRMPTAAGGLLPACTASTATRTPQFRLLSRTVTCTRELISIYMCYSQGGGLNTPLSRLSHLVLLGVLIRPCMRVKNCPVYPRNSQKFSSKKKGGEFRPRMPSIKTT